MPDSEACQVHGPQETGVPDRMSLIDETIFIASGLWVWIVIFSGGILTWLGFLYLGLRAGCQRWLRWSAIYGTCAALALVAAILATHGPKLEPFFVVSVCLIVVCFFGAVHLLFADDAWRDWKSIQRRRARQRKRCQKMGF